MSIILVGNGSSVLQQELGEKIDSHNIVVRFNNCVLEGYEQNIGQKCTFLARRACDDIKLHPVDMFQQIYVFVPLCKWTPFMPPVIDEVKQFYGNKCIIVGTNYTIQTAQKLGQNDPQTKWPSIGMLAIDYFLQYFKQLTLYGFDGIIDGREGHYFPKPPKDSLYHDFETEQNYIKQLITQKRIVQL